MKKFILNTAFTFFVMLIGACNSDTRKQDSKNNNTETEINKMNVDTLDPQNTPGMETSPGRNDTTQNSSANSTNEHQ